MIRVSAAVKTWPGTPVPFCRDVRRTRSSTVMKRERIKFARRLVATTDKLFTFGEPPPNGLAGRRDPTRIATRG